MMRVVAMLPGLKVTKKPVGQLRFSNAPHPKIFLDKPDSI